jgi:D-serine deaminase-like pyridoxal phosphate-dependent protein
MAQAGIRDVFVSNEIVGKNKLRRLCALTKLGTTISIAVDCKYNIDGAWTMKPGFPRTRSVFLEPENEISISILFCN